MTEFKHPRKLEPASVETDAQLWSYFRDKYGVMKALEQQYQRTIRDDPEIMPLFDEVKRRIADIDRVMKAREDSAKNGGDF